jgi:hypothetical protein
MLELVGRPPVESDELDIDPELIRQLGATGRRFIEAQVRLVVQLRQEIWQERTEGGTSTFAGQDDET